MDDQRRLTRIEQAAFSQRRAIIDVGSNSVRLVVYEGPQRTPVSIANEKMLCGLGRDMSAAGELNPDAFDSAIKTLKRFAQLLREYGNPPTTVFATAAIRAATNGADFILAAKELGFEIEIYSGETEAEMAASGVLSSVHMPNGLVGDLGGGSLELTGLFNGHMGDRISLSLGPFSLMRALNGDLSKIGEYVREELKSISWLKKGEYPRLYTVGGAWRAVARVHIDHRRHPLHILHEYEMSRADVIDICDLIAHQSPEAMNKIRGIPERRHETMPWAVLTLKELLLHTKPSSVVVSSSGVREGVLYSALTPDEQMLDPLIELSRYYASRLSPTPRYGLALETTISSIFEPEDQDYPEEKRLRHAACILCDMASLYHPDLRATHAFDTILRIPFTSLTHTERAWLALTLYRRYGGKSGDIPSKRVTQLLSREQLARATQTGLAMRMLATLAPRTTGILENCTIVRSENELILHLPEEAKSLMNESVRKRFIALASAMELEPREGDSL